ERVVGLRLVATDAEHREALVDEMLFHQLVNRRQELAAAQVSQRAADDERARIGAVARPRRRLRLRARTDGRAGHDFCTAWPPNSLRSAAITFPPNESAWRERKRVCSESVITGA